MNLTIFPCKISQSIQNLKSRPFQNELNAARGNLYAGTSFPTNFDFSDSLQRVFLLGSWVLATATRCNVPQFIIFNHFYLFFFFKVAAEHAEHVCSVKRALESTDKSLEDLQAAAAKEHEGNLLISYIL